MSASVVNEAVEKVLKEPSAFDKVMRIVTGEGLSEGSKKMVKEMGMGALAGMGVNFVQNAVTGDSGGYLQAGILGAAIGGGYHAYKNKGALRRLRADLKAPSYVDEAVDAASDTASGATQKAADEAKTTAEAATSTSSTANVASETPPPKQHATNVVNETPPPKSPVADPVKEAPPPKSPVADPVNEVLPPKQHTTDVVNETSATKSPVADVVNETPPPKSPVADPVKETLSTQTSTITSNTPEKIVKSRPMQGLQEQLASRYKKIRDITRDATKLGAGRVALGLKNVGSTAWNKTKLGAEQLASRYKKIRDLTRDTTKLGAGRIKRSVEMLAGHPNVKAAGAYMKKVLHVRPNLNISRGLPTKVYRSIGNTMSRLRGKMFKSNLQA